MSPWHAIDPPVSCDLPAVPDAVLLISQVFPPRHGGSGRWFWELYRRLQSVKVHVVAGHAASEAAFDRDAGLPITRLGLDFANWGVLHRKSSREYAHTLLELRRIISRVRPSALHSGKCLPEGLLAAALGRWSGIPFLVYAHGEELTLARTSGELRWLTARVLARASTVVANSVHTRQMLEEHWRVPGARILVMHPGVDTRKFAPAETSQQVRQQFGWSGRRVVLTAGTLQKRKGQDMLIRALPAIRAQVPEVLYVMVGEGPDRADLERLAADHHVRDAVQFRGAPSDDELVACYQQCDVFALPNRQVGWDLEGFGIVLIEAQACGKPVVTGRSGGTSEALEEGETGEVVSCETPGPLAATISALLQDPERALAMGRRGRAWVLRQFDWTVLANQADERFRAS